MINQRQAIVNFLDKVSPGHFYTPDMEVQVMVAQGNGTRVSGAYEGRKKFAYQDESGNQWAPFRIPYNAREAPEYKDRPMYFDLSEHAEAIGMTGYDWVNKRSVFVAYDFDAITGHKDAHMKRLSNDDLLQVQQAAEEIPWVTTRRSTSGNGLHLYVFLDLDITVNNHSEHAAIARSILHRMSGMAGFDFASRVDVCGSNMWVWHRNAGEHGYEVVKQGTTLSTISGNWRDHLQVTKSRKKHISTNRSIDKLSRETDFLRFDKQHRELILWLEETNRFYWYDADHHMVVTHVSHLKAAHEHLVLKGLFETISPGEDLSNPNCFMYPIANGGWVVRRYGKGTAEHELWEQDGVSWTKTYLNLPPTFETFCRAHGAIEDPKGGHIFKSLEHLKNALSIIDVPFEIPEGAHRAPAKLYSHSDGQRYVVQVEGAAWFHYFTSTNWFLNMRKHVAEKVIQLQVATGHQKSSVVHDDRVRHLVTLNNKNAGWAINTNGSWNIEPLEHVKMVLESQNLRPVEVRSVIGGLITNPWKLVVRPFEPEYPGDRQWNRNAPRLNYEPSAGNYDTWKSVFSHLGRELDSVVQNNEWCQMAGIDTGGEYLFYWVSSLIQYPTEPLPYLFIYGSKQNTGKSTFRESIPILFDGGVTDASSALRSASDFNGELEGQVLCYIDEFDLSQSKASYNRLKNWVTSEHLSVHVKHMTPYLAPNTTHWVQSANDRDYCPAFPNDTRITYIHVNHYPEKEIPRTELKELLRQEAPAVLHALLDLDIPPSNTRLRVPVLETSDKSVAMRGKMNPLERFLAEQCFQVPGAYVPVSQFKAAFHKYMYDEDLGKTEIDTWTNQKIRGIMLEEYQSGVYEGERCWGNLTLDATQENVKNNFKLVSNGKSMRKEYFRNE